MPDRPFEAEDAENVADDAHWRTAGDRIQTLLDASGAGGMGDGKVARERAEQLVAEVTDLYGAGLRRMMAIALTADPALAGTMAADNLVASLLLVHGLHPHSVDRRVNDALDSVRPYLGSHGGDVQLITVDGGPHNFTVRLRFAGSCRSCPSSSVTLELAVEDAIRAAAPEIESIEVVAAEPESKPTVISADSLLSRVRADRHGPVEWHPVPDLAGLTPGEVGGFRVNGATVLACRVGDTLFAYRDRCGSCGETLAGAVLHRAPSGDAVLRCPRCHAHFDVVHAGAGLDESGASADAHYLEPIPLLERDGVLSLAVAVEGVA